MEYSNFEQFLSTFKGNPGHQSICPFPIKDAYHIDTEFTDEGITRFQGVIKYGNVLRNLALLSNRVMINYDTILTRDQGSECYVCYTIWFDKPYKP